MKKLGFGMMRLPLLREDDPHSVDREQVCRMIDLFLEHGFTYFDTAYMYHGAESENIVRETLVRRYPRDRFQLATKLPTMRLEQEGDQERIFAEQLKKCGVDYFDNYLLHCLNTANYEKACRFGSFAFVEEMKRQGKIRHMGFSFHDTSEVLERILTDHPETDFVQLQINYLDWESDTVQSRRCYEICVRHKKPVIVMEPVKGGTLAKVPERVDSLFRKCRPNLSVASWAIRYAASLPNVLTVLSGMSDMEQLRDNIGYMENFEPLTDEEAKLLPQAAEYLNADIAVACTGCRYCMEGCPQKIGIPECLALYNAEKHEANGDKNRLAYERLTETTGRASSCIRCHRCERSCPQHIRIADAMKKIAETFEGK